MFTAAGASAAAFMVITKSGIAGTLVGAAVFSAVYHGASHGIGQAFERLVTWWLGRRGIEVPPHDEVDAGAESAVNGAESPVAGARGLRTRRALAVWAPLVLALAAFGASGYSLVTGAPIEKVIVRERVVEKPVVQERIVMHTQTVTVTVPAPPTYGSGGTCGAGPHKHHHLHHDAHDSPRVVHDHHRHDVGWWGRHRVDLHHGGSDPVHEHQHHPGELRDPNPVLGLRFDFGLECKPGPTPQTGLRVA